MNRQDPSYLLLFSPSSPNTFISQNSLEPFFMNVNNAKESQPSGANGTMGYPKGVCCKAEDMKRGMG